MCVCVCMLKTYNWILDSQIIYVYIYTRILLEWIIYIYTYYRCWYVYAIEFDVVCIFIYPSLLYLYWQLYRGGFCKEISGCCTSFTHDQPPLWLPRFLRHVFCDEVLEVWHLLLDSTVVFVKGIAMIQEDGNWHVQFWYFVFVIVRKALSRRNSLNNPIDERSWPNLV